MPRRSDHAALLAVALLIACSGPVAAEMSANEYRTGARRITEAERAQQEARAREERARVEAADQALRAAEEAARRDEERRLAARPPGVRLVERHCTACHAADALAQVRHGWLGWCGVVLRMEWLNGANLGPGERSVIVAHLADVQRASAARVAAEWLAAIAAIAVPLALLTRYLRRRPMSARPRDGRP